MKRLLTLLLLLLSTAGLAQQSWGVKLTVDLPVSDVPAFAGSPWTYATQHLDVLDVRAYAQWDRFGVEARATSATELSAGIYYAVSAAEVLGQLTESTLGLYVARDLQSGAVVVTLRGTLLLYGWTDSAPPEPP